MSYASTKNCKGDDSTAQGNMKEWGHTNKSKSTNEYTKHKRRLNTQKNTRPNRAVWTGPGSLCTWKTSSVQTKCQGPLQLISPPFLMTSTTKQMRPNGKGGGDKVLRLKAKGLDQLGTRWHGPKIQSDLCTCIGMQCTEILIHTVNVYMTYI